MRKSRRKRRRRRRTRRRRRGAGKKRRKQTFQPWQGKHSFNNNDNLDNISHKSVESEGNFPDTTNGELSVETTIEGQQPRDDGGGGPPVQFTARARNDAPKNDYYFPSGAHAVVGRPAAADALPPLEELSKSENLRRELASSSYSDVEGNAAVKRRLKGRWRNAARGAAAAAISARVDPAKEFKPLFPSHLITPEILADAETRRSLEIMKRDHPRVRSPVQGLADGLGSGLGDEFGRGRTTVTPPPPDAKWIEREKGEAAYEQSMRDQKQREKRQKYNKEDLAREAAAAAARDPKVIDAANAAAAETMFKLEMGGGRRKRRRKRRRTRKKRAGYGPITTGGWIHHNLLLPSQHLGSLGMWWT